MELAVGKLINKRKYIECNLCLGQYTRKGPVGALSKICPILKGKSKIEYYLFIFNLGAGVATVVITFWLTTYYIIILAWAFYYLVNSFHWDVPWKGCKNPWNKSKLNNQRFVNQSWFFLRYLLRFV
jgi:solute carrier family 6 GABA transporter-like protein 6/8/11/12/13